MALKPDIIHIVGYTEADHAATAEDVIESSTIARRAIENAMRGAPDMLSDPKVKNRINWLLHEAQITLNAIRSLSANSSIDPLIDPHVLAQSVITGIMDAPQLKNNPYASGTISTRIINGSCKSVSKTGKAISEQLRIEAVLKKREE